MKTLRALAVSLAVLFCSASILTACGSGVDDASASSDSLDAARRRKKHHCQTDKDCSNGQVCKNSTCANPPPPPPPPATCHANTDCSNGQVCVNGACAACTADNQCSNGEVCKAGACTPPPPPPAGGCTNSDDCQNGGLCDNGSCSASACNNRAPGKTGIRATVQITRYQGLIQGRNGTHEIAFGNLTNVLWIHDAATQDTSSVQLALNVHSSTDPTGLPQEVPLTVGQTIEVEGEYISGASAGSSGVAVIHFTHSNCGFVDVNGQQYR